MLLAVCKQVALLERRVLANDDDLDDLAGTLVGHAYRSGLEHAGMHRHHVFDLIREYFESRHDDHVFFAVSDANVAALVHESHITRAQPAVGGEYLPGLVGQVPVTAHHLRTAQHDFPNLTRRDRLIVVAEDGRFGARQWHADLAAPFLDRDRVRDGHWSALGKAIALDERYACSFFPALRNRTLHGHAACDRKLQMTQVDVGEARCIEQSAKQRVHPYDRREACRFQRLDECRHIARIEHQHDLSALAEEG